MGSCWVTATRTVFFFSPDMLKANTYVSTSKDNSTVEDPREWELRGLTGVDKELT